MTGTILGLAAALLAIGAWASWMRRLNQVSIPRDRRGYLAVCAGGAALGIAAFVAGAGIVGGIGAAFGILSGGLFLGLRAQSRQDGRKPAVTVGGPILDFAAPDDSGQAFELSSLRGKPILLKFFRGHW
jgi:hypothetical protein